MINSLYLKNVPETQPLLFEMITIRNHEKSVIQLAERNYRSEGSLLANELPDIECDHPFIFFDYKKN